MENIISLARDLWFFIGDMPVATVFLLLSLAFFGAHFVNALTDRDSLFHLALSLSVLFLGALGGTVMLGDLRLPLANEIVLSSFLALIGMTFAGLGLMLTYKRADI